MNVRTALILALTLATLELTNADSATRNLSCVQNVVKDSSGCSKGNGIWRQKAVQRAMRKAKTMIYSTVTFLTLLF